MEIEKIFSSPSSELLGYSKDDSNYKWNKCFDFVLEKTVLTIKKLFLLIPDYLQ